MKELAAVILLSICAAESVAEVVSFGHSDADFQIEFVEVGDIKNPWQPGTGLGSVSYEYKIGKYEISAGQFQDAVASSAKDGTGDLLELGIGNYGVHELIIPRRTQPIPTSWFSAARFVNWLNVSSGYGPAYKFETMPGDDDYNVVERDALPHTEGDPGFAAEHPFRSKFARYVIPTVDEWIKAAYYNSDTKRYSRFATGDETPTPVSRGSEPGTAVYGQPALQGPADVSQAGGPSSFGTIGQNGNVSEWMEGFPRQETNAAPLAGGGWGYRDAFSMTDLPSIISTYGGIGSGFRVAALPHVEPLPKGDFGMNALLDAEDIDLLAAQVRQRISTPRFDLTGDSHVDQEDQTFWVQDLFGTHFGDADLDGVVDFSDFLSLSDSFGQSGGWASGDFDGSGGVGFPDFLLLSSNYGSGSEAAAVPEPNSQVALGIGAVLLLNCRRRREPAASVVDD